MSNLLLQKIVLQRVTEVGKIILKKKRPLLLARSVEAKWTNSSTPLVIVPHSINWINRITEYFYPGGWWWGCGGAGLTSLLTYLARQAHKEIAIQDLGEKCSLINDVHTYLHSIW